MGHTGEMHRIEVLLGRFLPAKPLHTGMHSSSAYAGPEFRQSPCTDRYDPITTTLQGRDQLRTATPLVRLVR